jgi:hypothetical protein
MGAGHVQPGGKSIKGSLFEPGLAYDAGFLNYLGFLCDAAPEIFSNPAATCAALASAGLPLQAENLNLPSIGIAELPGSAAVQRTVTSVAKEQSPRRYAVSIEPPLGYNVTVSPSTIVLKSGQSATYSVSFLNTDSSSVGEWRFGALTWTDTTGNYKVRSPLAVHGILFGAPAELFEVGTAGTASFDVRFNHTGFYTAAAHGLAPAVVNSDNVLQDPDQTFSPSDGYSDEHQFNLSGATVFRLALPPEATESGADLDLYVFNPSGQLMASSTVGGTDELVTLLNPADGTWKVFVHGWATPGGDSDYRLSSWVVSATPVGNLTIDSAPATAAIGTGGTVRVNWAGLADSMDYLGAISHTGDPGLLGMTLVNVSTR